MTRLSFDNHAGTLFAWPHRPQEITVPAVRLDGLHAAGELDGVTLVEIDVEGHELSAMGGALDFIAAARAHGHGRVHAGGGSRSRLDAGGSIALLRRAGEVEFEALAETDGQVLPFPLPADDRGRWTSSPDRSDPLRRAAAPAEGAVVACGASVPERSVRPRGPGPRNHLG